MSEEKGKGTPEVSTSIKKQLDLTQCSEQRTHPPLATSERYRRHFPPPPDLFINGYCCCCYLGKTPNTSDISPCRGVGKPAFGEERRGGKYVLSHVSPSSPFGAHSPIASPGTYRQKSFDTQLHDPMVKYRPYPLTVYMPLSNIKNKTKHIKY